VCRSWGVAPSGLIVQDALERIKGGRDPRYPKRKTPDRWCERSGVPHFSAQAMMGQAVHSATGCLRKVNDIAALSNVQGCRVVPKILFDLAISVRLAPIVFVLKIGPACPAGSIGASR
jgi:hypothetical protein